VRQSAGLCWLLLLLLLLVPAAFPWQVQQLQQLRLMPLQLLQLQLLPWQQQRDLKLELQFVHSLLALLKLLFPQAS
jgi:hypothetical protein